MKVGTDGVLLGAWAELPLSGRILDVGTGTGLIALMAAQRTAAEIVGVEIDPDAAGQAAENVQASPWASRCTIVCSDIADYRPAFQFDAILSNPPYYGGTLLPPDAGRARARHTSSLPFPLLARAARRLLLPDVGTLQVVLPCDEEDAFLAACAPAGLYPSRRTLVRTRPGKASSRLLLALSPRNLRTREDELLLMDADGGRSEAYRQLTAAFYL
ncbi:MAG: methyltransferase [Alloprevotella sp.]|nr:methyltransferase [Alloprevotella sp.]